MKIDPELSNSRPEFYEIKAKQNEVNSNNKIVITQTGYLSFIFSDSIVSRSSTR